MIVNTGFKCQWLNCDKLVKDNRHKLQETCINLYEDRRTLFSNDKAMIGKLTRLGLPIVKENDYGTWFDLTGINLEIQVPKKRGQGQKTLII